MPKVGIAHSFFGMGLEAGELPVLSGDFRIRRDLTYYPSKAMSVRRVMSLKAHFEPVGSG
jgi:hypothetical protein